MKNQFWATISDIGTQFAYNQSDKQFIRLSNRISFSVLVAILLPAYLINIGFGRYNNLISLSELVALFGVVFFFNAKGLNQISRYIMAFLPTPVYYLPYLAQTSDSFEFYTYLFVLQAMSLGAMVLLKFPEEKWPMILVLFLFLSSFWTLDHLFKTPTDPVILEYIQSERYLFLKVVSTLCWLLIVLVFLFMKYSNHLFSTNLQRANQELISKETNLVKYIDELEELREQLREKDLENQNYFDAIKRSFIVAEFSPEGKILEMNPRAVAFFETNYTKVVGQHHADFDLLVQQDPKRYQQFWERIRKGKPITKETQFQVGGVEKTLAETYAPVSNLKGEVTRVVSIAHDITQRNLIQQKLEAQTAETRKRNQKLEFYGHALVELTKNKALIEGDFQTALQEVLVVAAEQTGTSRVSFWSYHQNDKSILCEKLYDLEKDTFSNGIEITANDYPNYFKGLKNEPFIEASEADKDPYLADFKDSYLDPLQIKSMLDIPVIADGIMLGVVCFEMQNVTRQWLPEDRFFAQSMADIVSLAIVQKQRRIAEQEIKKQSYEIEAQNEELRVNQEEILRQRRTIEERNLTLQASQAKLNTLIDNIPVGIMVVNTDYTISSLNLHGEKMIGKVTAGTTIQQIHEQLKVKGVGTGRAINVEETPLKKVLEGRMASIQEEITTAEGKKVYLEVIGAPLFNSQNEVESAIIIFQDITEKQEHQFTLQLMEATLFNSHDSIWLIDGEKIISSNPAGLQLFEIETPSDILGKTPVDFSPELQPDGSLSAQKAQEMISTAFEKGTRFFEWKHQTAKGKTFDAEVLLSGFIFQGKPYVQGVIRDISSRKQQENELLATNKLLAEKEKELSAQQEELLSQNEQLTNALEKLKATQSQLVHSEKMATLGQLTAGVAHEINNPINFIKSGASGLRKAMNVILEILEEYNTLNEENTSQKLQEIEQLKARKSFDLMVKGLESVTANIEMGIERTVELVKELKLFSRNEDGQFLKTNVHEGINSTLLLLQNQYKNRIRIVKHYQPIPEIMVNPGRINQVFMNLLSNAVQAIPKEGTITISTEMEDPSTLKITIADDGPGIPDAIRAKIFEPFFTTKPPGEGTGLGLPISSQIVQQHHGKLAVESTPEKGTSFYIYLPVKP